MVDALFFILFTAFAVIVFGNAGWLVDFPWILYAFSSVFGMCAAAGILNLTDKRFFMVNIIMGIVINGRISMSRSDALNNMAILLSIGLIALIIRLSQMLSKKPSSGSAPQMKKDDNSSGEETRKLE